MIISEKGVAPQTCTGLPDHADKKYAISHEYFKNYKTDKNLPENERVSQLDNRFLHDNLKRARNRCVVLKEKLAL